MALIEANIIKKRSSFLIQSKNNFDDYIYNLTPNSKRFYNRCIKKYDNACVSFERVNHNNIKILLKNEVLKHFQFSYKTALELLNIKNVILQTVKKENELIACNLLWSTPQPRFNYIYSSCPLIFNKNNDLNNFLWFKTIEYINKDIINICYLDLGFESINLIGFSEIINNRIKTNGFDNIKNNSKFIFLTKPIKSKEVKSEPYVMVVCNCGQKVLLNLSMDETCFSCGNLLNKV